jgi:tape measure domain-containing protein
MSNIEDQIVAMRFDNKQFEAGVKSTLSILDRLKAGLNFGGAAKGIQDVQTAGSRFTLRGMLDGTSGVSASFIAMSTIAITALSQIATRAVSAGGQFVKSFSFGPVMDGLHEYETNLKSIQTIQANTDQPLTKINRSLEELNRYSDQTIYNFSEMARNIGTFTAAGVDLNTATSSIKGISNLAALSGSSSEQASTAMYQLSQAIAAGKVGLQDWNSVVNAGMGGKKLQTALATTAIAMGGISKESVKLEGPLKKLTINGESFRESISSKPGQEGWLSSEVLVNTLATLDGRFSKANLMAEKTKNGLNKYTEATAEAAIATSRLELEKKNGVKYTDEQFASLMQLSDASYKSATEVKTLGQVFDVAKETIGSGWSASFQSIFGNLNEAKALFTGMSGTINDMINTNALARNTMLADWKKLGGRNASIEGLKNVFVALGSVLKPIKDAFREIFPAKTGADLASMSKRFEEFTEKLKIGPETASNLKATFAGLFALFDIGRMIVGGIISMFGKMFGALDTGNGGLLSFTGGLGSMIVAIRDALKNGTFLSTFFEGLGNLLALPIKLLSSLAGAIGQLFSGFSSDNAANGLTNLGNAAAPVVAIGARLRAIWDSISSVFSNLGGLFDGVGTAIASSLGDIGDALAGAITPETFSTFLSALNAGLLGGILLTLKNFFKGGASIDISGGLFGAASETLGAVTGQLKAMQTQIKAQTLLKIAGALALLTLSIFVLSTIDPKKLATALGGAITGLAAMQVSIIGLSKAISMFGAAKLPFITLALVLLGGAMLLFAFAVKTLASLSWNDMVKGLVGVAAMLAMVSAASVVLSKNSGGLVRAGAGMIIMGLGLKVMASALKDYAAMDWSEMAKGMAGVATMLGIISVAARAIPKSIIVTAVGLVIFAGAVKLLADALSDMSQMSWSEMGKGLAVLASAIGIIAVGLQLLPKSFVFTAASLLILAIALQQISNAVQDMATLSWQDLGRGMAVLASSLLVIAGAMRLMPKTLIVTAAGLLVLSVAIRSISDTVATMATMSWDEFGKGMAVLGGALAILAIALNVMKGTLLGSASLLVAAGALSILTPILIALSGLSWEAIGRGLTALAGGLAVMAVAGLTMGPLLPVLFGLSAAMLLFGAGVALVGAGVLAFSTGIAALVAVGGVAIAFITALISSIVSAIPPAMAALAQGIIGFATVISEGAPAFTAAFVAVLTSLIAAVVETAPKVATALIALLLAALNALRSGVPKLMKAGVDLLVALLKGFKDNIPRLAAAAVEAIIAFVNAIAKQAPKLADAGAKAVIKLINGISKAIDDNAADLGEAGGRLGVAIVKGMITGVGSMVGELMTSVKNVAGQAFKAAKDKLHIPGGPSKVFEEVGEGMGMGVISGLRNLAGATIHEASKVGDGVVSAMRNSMASIPALISADMDVNPTIAPVIDLDQFRKDATQMGSLIDTNVIVPLVSFQAASSIASDTSNDADDHSDETGGEGPSVQLIQNNYSPKAIGAVEVYRGTKNLISLAEEALGA